MMYDIEAVRADFPALKETVYGKPLVFLDSAASAQKPAVVIEKMSDFYRSSYANVHRGLYALSEKATDAFENARRKIAVFIHADADEVIFTRGSTESINLVASSWGEAFLNAGDEIVLSQAEHHSNIVPWQLLREKKGIVIKVVPVRQDGSLDTDAFHALLSEKTKLVSIMQVSNVLGTVFPVEEIIQSAHDVGAKVLIDGCQAIAHFPVDVRKMDCDFYVFSGHKMYGPTGIGVLYAKKDILKAMPPYQGGGDMIKTVSFEKSTWADPPARFEAGTPAIVQAVGLGYAVDYLTDLTMESIASYEEKTATYLMQALMQINGLRLLGTTNKKAGVASFVIDGIHPQDLSMVLDRQAIAVRVGHHCAQPLHEFLGVSVSTRASLGLYNTIQEVDDLVTALYKAKKMFGV